MSQRQALCMPRAISVVLGRFGEMLGRGVVDVLHEDRRMTVVGRDLDLHELEQAAARWAPVVAVIEDGAVSLPGLRMVVSSMPTVVLVHKPSVRRRETLEASGARCLAMDAPGAELLVAVRTLVGSVVEPLTPRELEVLGLIRTGKTSKEIAASMHLSVETVRTYTVAIRRKFGVKTKRELIVSPPRGRR